MKKLYLMMAFACIMMQSVAQSDRMKPSLQVEARHQANVMFINFNLFSEVNISSMEKAEIEKVIKKGTVLSINKQTLASINSNKPENISLTIPSTDGPVTVELYKVSIFDEGFSVITADNNQPFVYTEGVHYRGSVKGDVGSVAAISIFNNEVTGLIAINEKNYVLGKLKSNAADHHIFYNDKNLQVNPSSDCHTINDGETYTTAQLTPGATETVKCVRLYWEVNYDIVLDLGSTTAALNYVTAVFNQTAALYNNDAISVLLSQMFVWNVASPYTATTTSSLLAQFQNFRNSFNGDLGHLIGFAGNGGIAAGFSGLCNANLDQSQCYSGIYDVYNNVPVFSWTVEVVTHEQGHLLGSRHTHACVWNGNNTSIDGCAGYVEGSCALLGNPVGGGTIMSYCHLTSVGINFNLGFGPQPQTLLINNINTAPCLANCVVPCPVPAGLFTNTITTTSAQFNWTAVSGAADYNVRYRIIGAPSFINFSTATNSYTASNLTAFTNYEWQVQTNCTGVLSDFSASTNFTTLAASVCAQPINRTNSNITTTSAEFNWNAVAGATGYTVQYRLVGGTVTTVNVATNSYTKTGLQPSTTYQWRVRAVCQSGNSTYSAFLNVTTIGGVGYCASSGTSATEFINRVTLGSISNLSGNNGGYFNYTALSTNLIAGNNNTITMFPGFVGVAVSEAWKVYIDYNQNGVFTDAGENVATGAGAGTVVRNFIVPATALNGSTRMRVQMKRASYTGNPCLVYANGEVEDYSVVISGGALASVLNQSSIEVARLTSNELDDVKIYPNPAQQMITLTLNATNNAAGVATVYNLMGEKLMVLNNTIVEGDNKMDINTSQLGNGSYVLELTSGEQTVRQKFMIFK